MDRFDDGDDEEGSCKTRVNSIYWGGLWHVSDTTFMSIHGRGGERIFEKEYNMHAESFTFGVFSLARSHEDEDVRFNLCIAAADFGEAEEKILLEMIVALWVTICGFSFVSGWIEQYKQTNKI